MMSVAGAVLPYSLVLDLVSMAMTLPSSETPANRPRLREYEYTSAVKFWSVAADAARPTGPAATEASRAQRELAVGDAFDALARGEHQHDVGGLHADLPADVAAGDARP